MSSDETIEFVTNYLTNFFSESTEDEIKSVLLETNPAILQVIATLVDHENSFE